MEAIKVLLDNDTANRIAELDEEIACKAGKFDTSESKYIEDRDYLGKITVCLEKKGLVRLYYNPWGEREGCNTKQEWKRQAILREYQKRRFASFHSATFPILMSNDNPATFVKDEQDSVLDEIFSELPKKYHHDLKALAEALLNPINFEYLLTCNRKHLAADELRNKLKEKGLKLKICTPKELYEEVSNKLSLR